MKFYALKKSLTIFSPVLLFVLILGYSCSSDDSGSAIESTVTDSERSFLVTISSSGSYNSYNSAITINAMGSLISANNQAWVNYLAQHSLRKQAEHSFIIQPTDSLAVRLILGEDLNKTTVSEEANIRIRIFSENDQKEDKTFILAPGAGRTVVFYDFFE